MIKANLGLFIFSIFKFLDNYLNEKRKDRNRYDILQTKIVHNILKRIFRITSNDIETFPSKKL